MKWTQDTYESPWPSVEPPRQSSVILCSPDRRLFWEFVGGKRKQYESIREAAFRELGAELRPIARSDAGILEVSDSYPNGVAEEFSLYPVRIESENAVVTTVDNTSLSSEHDEAAWTTLVEFGAYETLGQ